MARSLSVAALVLSLCAGNAGCVQKMLINGQASATRKASVALSEIGDPEVARIAAMNGLANGEGVHFLAPDNEDTMFMLTRGWTSYGYAFCEEDMDIAKEAGDKRAADYHKGRARHAYERAVHYATMLLDKKASGFADARKSPASIKEWAERHFSSKEDAEPLFWAGYALLARASLLAADEPAHVGELFVPIALLERSRTLDPSYYRYGASTAIASYMTRSAQSPEFEQGGKLFEEVLQKTERKSLMAVLNYATRYFCAKGDRANYEKLVKEVLEAGDLSPSDRLSNALAKKKARRAFSVTKMMDCGFDMSKPPPEDDSHF